MLTACQRVHKLPSYCRLKAYILLFLGPTNKSFRNKSGKAQPMRTKFGRGLYVDMSRGNNVQRFCARSAHFGQNGGWDESREARVFLCGNPEDLSATSHGRFSPNLVVHCSVAESGKTFSKLFTLGIICPQNLTSKIGQTSTSLRAGYTGHGMHCREIVFTPFVVQGPGSF